MSVKINHELKSCNKDRVNIILYIKRVDIPPLLVSSKGLKLASPLEVN